MQFSKYHGLGNDYIVMNPGEIGHELSVENIQLICHRNYGIGSDGILWGPFDADGADFGLRIYNPDGSEAEKSGNGLRIFSRYLWDNKLVSDTPFSVWTPGGIVRSQILDQGERVDVEMGKVSFSSLDIPVAGELREVLNESISVQGQDFKFCAATVGNPHCVILSNQISEALARRIGPDIEADSRFPNKTNVQFMKVLNRNNIQIEIWERGAGYTLASGSSSSAAASVAYRLGLCDGEITVHMPGGKLSISITEDYEIRMVGPVTRIGTGVIDKELFTWSIR